MLPPILYVNLYENSAGGCMLPLSGILNQHSVILQKLNGSTVLPHHMYTTLALLLTLVVSVLALLLTLPLARVLALCVPFSQPLVLSSSPSPSPSRCTMPLQQYKKVGPRGGVFTVTAQYKRPVGGSLYQRPPGVALTG
jgi:hypothetical protein